MTIGMVVWALSVGALVTAGAWSLARLARRAGRQERWIWTAALVLAAVASWVPTLPEGPATSGEVVEVRAVELGRAPGASGADAASPGVLDRLLGGLPDVGAAELPGFRVGWTIAALLLLAALLVVEFAHRRRRARMPKTRIWGFPACIDERGGPGVAGVITPTLVIGRQVLALAGERRRALVTHELEHLRAGDVRLVAFAYVLVAIAVWNPACWLLARQLVLATEADCDRRTLRRRRTRPRAYVQLLLDVARWHARPPPAAIRLSMGRDARRLMRRLDLVLAGRRGRRLPSILLLAGVGALSPGLADPPRVLAEAPEPAGRYWSTVAARPLAEAVDTIRAVAGRATTAGPGSPGPDSAADPSPVSIRGTVAGGVIRRVDRPQPDGAVRLPTPRAAFSDIEGRGAFTVHPDAGGSVSRIDTEMATSDAFEAQAREWLSLGEYAPSDGTVHVWVAADSGRWRATPVSADLYARTSLGTALDRLRSLVDTWARLDTGAVLDLPTATATFTPDPAEVRR